MNDQRSRYTDDELRQMKRSFSGLFFSGIATELLSIRAENERLREAIPALYGQYDDEGNPLWMDGAVRQMFALRAENERLREALQEIEFHGGPASDCARAALNRGEILAEPQK